MEAPQKTYPSESHCYFRVIGFKLHKSNVTDKSDGHTYARYHISFYSENGTYKELVCYGPDTPAGQETVQCDVDYYDYFRDKGGDDE